MNKKIKYDVGADEALPYQDAAFHAIVWVGVLEQVSYLARFAAYVPIVVCPSGLFFYDTINKNPLSWLTTIQVA